MPTSGCHMKSNLELKQLKTGKFQKVGGSLLGGVLSKGLSYLGVYMGVLFGCLRVDKHVGPSA